MDVFGHDSVGVAHSCPDAAAPAGRELPVIGEREGLALIDFRLSPMHR